MHARPLPRLHQDTANRSVIIPQTNPASSLATATTATLYLGGLPLAPPAELDPDPRAVSVAPRRLHQDLRRWALPVLVIEPRCSLDPLECSEGTRPVNAINWVAVANRWKSHTSAAMVTAERESIPRKHRSFVTAASSGGRVQAAISASIARSSTRRASRLPRSGGTPLPRRAR